MKEFEQKLSQYLMENNIQGEQLIFEDICHSVEDAARAANAHPKDIVKSICFMDEEGNLIVAIVGGEDRASTSKVAKALELDAVRVATPDEILQRTGYPCGGVPSFGYKATFLIDARVMERETILAGGGSPYALVRISPEVLQKANGGKVLKIRK